MHTDEEMNPLIGVHLCPICGQYELGLISLLALGFPIAGISLAVALGFDLALDGVAIDLAAVLGDALHVVALHGDGEADGAIFEGGIGDRGLGVVAAENHAGGLAFL